MIQMYIAVFVEWATIAILFLIQYIYIYIEHAQQAYTQWRLNWNHA